GNERPRKRDADAPARWTVEQDAPEALELGESGERGLTVDLNGSIERQRSLRRRQRTVELRGGEPDVARDRQRIGENGVLEHAHQRDVSREGCTNLACHLGCHAAAAAWGEDDAD